VCIAKEGRLLKLIVTSHQLLYWASVTVNDVSPRNTMTMNDLIMAGGDYLTLYETPHDRLHLFNFKQREKKRLFYSLVSVSYIDFCFCCACVRLANCSPFLEKQDSQ